MADVQQPLHMVYYYASEDEEICKELANFLLPLERRGLFTSWASYCVPVGANLKQETLAHFAQADIVLPLVSSDFLASSLQSNEMQDASVRCEEGKIIIIPVILSPCLWQITSLQAIKPISPEPITQWPRLDEAFNSIAEKLQVVIENTLASKRQEPVSSELSLGAIYEKNAGTRTSSGEFFAISGIGGRDIQIELLPQKKHVPKPLQEHFCYNVPLPSPFEFFGRDSEWREILLRCQQYANVSVIGPHRSGKTWLLQRFIQQAPHVLSSEYRIGFLNAYAARCSTVAGFVATVLDELGIHIATPVDRYDMVLLEIIVKTLSECGFHFVLCIDKIDKLYNQQEFTPHFFGSLRSLEEKLILITTSELNLWQVFAENKRTSDFFNNFLIYPMLPFTEAEAQNFLRVKGAQVGLSKKEREALLLVSEQETGWYPVRLQLAGHLFSAEKESGRYKNVGWDNYWEGFEERLNEAYEHIKGPV